MSTASPTRVRRAGAAVFACCVVLFGPASARADVPTDRVRPVADPQPVTNPRPVADLRPIPPPVPPAPPGLPGPRAFADVVGTRAGQSVNVAVLADDTGEGLVVLSHTNPEHGLVFQAEDATGTDAVLRYTPGPGFVGRDDFRYTVSDRFGRQATANVRVEVTPATGRVRESTASRVVDRLRTAPTDAASRPRSAGAGSGGRVLLVVFLGSAVLGAGFLALVARRRRPRARAAHAFRSPWADR
ncbi:Ig-like domain-containing protein [Embleya scabrispora]|uniref:Ig-like domain-containing protein n=1 Tax=Embleya scabrispora TaxID=159449 RepID=UPI0011804F78|nr:Ig-like domain-containing protein [Embleya scabrispora]